MESGIGNIVAITNYREYKNDLYSDDDSIELQLLETRRTTDHYQLSQEIRDSFNLTDNIELLIGGFGFLQRYELLQDGVLDGFLPGLGQPQSQWQKNWHLSAFSQVYVDLSEAFRLQAGIRYTHEETKAHSTTANTLSPVPGGPASFDDPIIPGSFVEARGKKSWDEFGWKIGLDYQVTEASMVYGYYARGFKSGGFVGRIVFAEDIGPFDPETLDTFEIGLKSDLFDRRLRINLAAFYNIYKDMQVVQNITYASGANSATIQNAAKAKTKGIELEITAVPVDGLTIAAAGAYLDAAYSEFDTFVLAPNGIDLIPVSFAGNELMNAPKWSGSASVTYDAPVGPGFATIFTEYTYSDPKYTNFTNFPQERTRAIGLFNATLSWRPESERWSIGVYGRNLANKKYFAQKLFLPGTLALGNLGAPREYGLDFRYNW